MNKTLKKIKRNVTLLWHSLFWGMKAVNDEILSQTDDSESSQIIRNLGAGGVFNDLLEEKQTQEVKEMRDEYYRVYKESDKYKVEIDSSCFDRSTGSIISDLKTKTRKKTIADFKKHVPVDESDGFTLRVIQDNKHIAKECINTSSQVYDYDTLLTVKRDDFIPKFLIEKLVSKIVVKTKNDKESIIDLYLPTVASQFGKIDAIIIANLNKIFTNKDFRNPLFDFKELSFVTDKAWNSESLCEFKYDNIKMIDMIIFDGHFVARFNANTVIDGESIIEKYHTKEMDLKFEQHAPVHEAVNIFDICNKDNIDGNNLADTKLKLS